jgi:hypothetical protein
MTQRINAEVELIRGSDGTWLCIEDAEGRKAMLHLDLIARDGITRAAFLHWADGQFNSVNRRGHALMPCIIERAGFDDQRQYSFASWSPLGDQCRTLGIAHIQSFRSVLKVPLESFRPEAGSKCAGFIQCRVLDLQDNHGHVKIELPDGQTVRVEAARLQPE